MRRLGVRIPGVETLNTQSARRLALHRAGLLDPKGSGLPRRAAGRGQRARRAAHAVIGRFGYLQLDSVSVAGARSHALVLLSRLEGFDPALGEELLQPGEPLFEYWGHEACWLPLELYPLFAFRRRAYRDEHPWWGDLVTQHPDLTRTLRHRIRDEGPLRSADLDEGGSKGWWGHGPAKKVLTALWSSGELAIRERRGFHRFYDLAERVIPETWRDRDVPSSDALPELLLIALGGHGWATTGTLAATWRLRNLGPEIATALARLQDEGRIVPCALVGDDGRRQPGWVRPDDLATVDRLLRRRPRNDRGILLSPFDPLLWDRARVGRLFGFEQVLEIFKPAAQRKYGYYCLPVLAGERLVARLDLKAERAAGRLRVLARHLEPLAGRSQRAARTAQHAAVTNALERYSEALALKPVGP